MRKVRPRKGRWLGLGGPVNEHQTRIIALVLQLFVWRHVTPTESSLPGVRDGWSIADPGGHCLSWLLTMQFQGLHHHFKERIATCVLASKLGGSCLYRGLSPSSRSLGSSSEFLAVLVRIPYSAWISKTPSSGPEIWRGPTLTAVTLACGKDTWKVPGMTWKRLMPFLEGKSSFLWIACFYFLWLMCWVDHREFAY